MLYGTPSQAGHSGIYSHDFGILDIAPDVDPHLAAVVPHRANVSQTPGGGFHASEAGGTPAPGTVSVAVTSGPTWHGSGRNVVTFVPNVGLRTTFSPTTQGGRVVSYGAKGPIKRGQFPAGGIYTPSDLSGLSGGFFGDVGKWFSRAFTTPRFIRRFEQKSLGGVITKAGRVTAATAVGTISGGASGFMVGGPAGAAAGAVAGGTYGFGKGIYGEVSGAPVGRTWYQTLLPSFGAGAAAAYIAPVLIPKAGLAATQTPMIAPTVQTSATPFLQYSPGYSALSTNLPLQVSALPTTGPLSTVYIPPSISGTGAGGVGTFLSTGLSKIGGTFLSIGTKSLETVAPLLLLQAVMGGGQQGAAQGDMGGGGVLMPGGPTPTDVPYNPTGGSSGSGSSGEEAPPVAAPGISTGTIMLAAGGATIIYLLMNMPHPRRATA